MTDARDTTRLDTDASELPGSYYGGGSDGGTSGTSSYLEYQTTDGVTHRVPYVNGSFVIRGGAFDDFEITESTTFTGTLEQIGRPWRDLVVYTWLSVCTILNSIAIIVLAVRS